MTQLFSVAVQVGPVDVSCARYDQNENQMQVAISACVSKGEIYVQPSFTFYASDPAQLLDIARAFMNAAAELKAVQEGRV